MYKIISLLLTFSLIVIIAKYKDKSESSVDIWVLRPHEDSFVLFPPISPPFYCFPQTPFAILPLVEGLSEVRDQFRRQSYR